VEEAGAPYIEVISVIERRNGDWIGLLVGRFNMTILQSALGGTNVDYPISSYLVSDEDQVIVAATQPEGAVTPSISEGVTRARQGQTGLEQYRLASSETVLGYYAPIRGTRLGFVSELSLAAIEARSVGYFAARAFSLVVAFLALVGLAIALMATLNHQIAPPLQRLRKATLALGKGDFSTEVKDSHRGDEVGSLASSFVLMRDQVQALVSELQSRLEARSRDIDTTQEISRFTATQRDLQSLLDRICALLVERFPIIYHAQVFLLDSERENAILQASTGEAGNELLRRGHRLAVGSISLVGQAVEQRGMMIARDTESSDVWRPNPLLPDTRAELALPLFFREVVIGVLDVQSKQREAFSGEQVAVLQTIANQIAVGIQTAQLYEQSVRRLEEIEEANRKATARVWQEYMRAQRVTSMSASAGRVPEVEDATARRAAITTGKPIVGSATARQTLPIAIPINIGGQTIGAVEWEVPAQEFDENVLDMAQELAKRLAISLENARLFQESRRAAERERMVNAIAARLSEQSNVHDILQTAVREVGQALRTPQVSIRLHGAEKSTEY
jgi:GAF domain-containing protein/HAMP domain-containing protein